VLSYGKTSAVQSYLQKAAPRDNAKVHWQETGDGDIHGAQFWEIYCNGVAHSNPPLAARLISLGFPETDKEIERHAQMLLSLSDWEHIHYTIIDNFHNADARVVRFVEKTVRALPKNSRVILICRTMPKFESITRSGFIYEDAMQFTPKEIDGFYKASGVTLSDKLVDDIYADSQNGWAYFLSSLLSMFRVNGKPKMTQDDYAEALTAAKGDMVAYLDGSVFDKLSPQLQTAIVLASGIYNVPAPLIDAYVNEDEKSAISVLLKYNPMSEAYEV
jgi:ATP/maltotriose-dependent transcriptional regulator MalT